MNEEIVEFSFSVLLFLPDFQCIYTLFTPSKQTKDRVDLNTMFLFLSPSYTLN